MSKPRWPCSTVFPSCCPRIGTGRKRSFAVTLSDSAPAVSPVTIRAEDGSGLIQLAGRVPGTSEGSLLMRVLGLDLHDAYGLLQRDTLGVGGSSRYRCSRRRHGRAADAARHDDAGWREVRRFQRTVPPGCGGLRRPSAGDRSPSLADGQERARCRCHAPAGPGTARSKAAPGGRPPVGPCPRRQRRSRDSRGALPLPYGRSPASSRPTSMSPAHGRRPGCREPWSSAKAPCRCQAWVSATSECRVAPGSRATRWCWTTWP